MADDEIIEVVEESDDIEDVDDSPSCPYCGSPMIENERGLWVCDVCEITVTITPFEEILNDDKEAE